MMSQQHRDRAIIILTQHRFRRGEPIPLPGDVVGDRPVACRCGWSEPWPGFGQPASSRAEVARERFAEHVVDVLAKEGCM